MQRIKELDSIRGLAAVAIVIYHLWLPHVGLLGAAVDLFFVLSGFLITSILLNHEITCSFLVSFYARRALRIWPVYYFSLLILVLLARWIPGLGRLDGLVYFATFTQNIPYYWSSTAPEFIHAFRHTWSVAIEEQFYLFWPALLWAIGRRGMTPIGLGLIVAAVLTRAMGFNSWILITHCDGLVLGALLALWTNPQDEEVLSRKPGLFTLGLLSGVFWAGTAAALWLLPSEWQPTLGRPVQSLRLLSLNLVFVSLVGLAVRYSSSNWLEILRHPWLTYLGTISYGLYLYHHIVFMLLDDYAASAGIQSNVAVDLSKLLVSGIIAGLSWKYLEQPFLAFKSKFPYQPSRTKERQVVPVPSSHATGTRIPAAPFPPPPFRAAEAR